MKYEIIQTREFSTKARKARLTSEDLREIENEIVADPDAWPVMAGTGGLRKMRFSPSTRNAGKSGGIRVCYFVVDSIGHLWLVTLFAKNKKTTLPLRSGMVSADLLRRSRSWRIAPKRKVVRHEQD